MKEIHRPPPVKPEKSDSSSYWVSGLNNLRNEVSTAIEYGKTVSSIASLIAIAGLLYWCPRCGQWMGEGSEGQGPGAPKPNLPPPPKRLLKALGVPLEGEPTPTRDLPKRDGNKLTPNSGVLIDDQAKYGEKPAKRRYNPPSEAHGRKVDTYYDGHPKPDSYPHAHSVDFERGDGEQVAIYHRERDGTPILDNSLKVTITPDDNVYHWDIVPREGE